MKKSNKQPEIIKVKVNLPPWLSTLERLLNLAVPVVPDANYRDKSARGA